MKQQRERLGVSVICDVTQASYLCLLATFDPRNTEQRVAGKSITKITVAIILVAAAFVG